MVTSACACARVQAYREWPRVRARRSAGQAQAKRGVECAPDPWALSAAVWACEVAGRRAMAQGLLDEALGRARAIADAAGRAAPKVVARLAGHRAPRAVTLGIGLS